MKKNLKAQIRMSETIAVMFIFFVLILFGIIFYYKYSQVAFKEEQEEQLGERAVKITLKAIFLPELVCSRGEAQLEDNCFDMLKLIQVREVFEQHFGEYYSDLFPYAKISVKKIYPPPTLDEIGEWILYEKIKPDWTKKEETRFLLALKDEITGLEAGEDAYSLGVLTVEVYG